MSRNRAISVTLDYVLMLSIAMIVLASVVFLSGHVVDGQLNQGAEEELTATGESLAADLETAARLTEVGEEDTSVRFQTDLPRQVSGSSYDISVRENELELTSTNPDQSVTVPVAVDAIEETEVRGGPLVIELVDGQLEVSER